MSTLLLFAGSNVVCGFSLDEYLRMVNEQNLQLKSSALTADALSDELASENRLEPLSVEYSPFFRRGAGGVASSELIIQQEFDFPTVYSARRKAARKQVESAVNAGAEIRREVLLSAKSLYLDMVYAEKVKNLCAERYSASDNILQLVEKQFENGVATTLDINRAEMEVMSAKAALIKSDGVAEAAKMRVMSLLVKKDGIDGGIGYPALQSFNENDSTLIAKLVNLDPELQRGRSEVLAEDAQVNLAKQNLLPRLAVGYRRNTEEKVAANGFLVGASFPLYSGNGAVKAARRRSEAKLLENETSRMKLEGELAGKNVECAHLQKALSTYNLTLLKESLALMRKGVELRHISLQDYYVQASEIYDKLEEYLELENQLQQAASELMANTL